MLSRHFVFFILLFAILGPRAQAESDDIFNALNLFEDSSAKLHGSLSAPDRCEPAAPQLEALADGSDYWGKNVSNHPCPKRATPSAQLEDLFASTCSCPVRGKRPLAALEKAESSSEAMRAKILGEIREAVSKDKIFTEEHQAAIKKLCNACALKFGASVDALGECLGVPDGSRIDERPSEAVIMQLGWKPSNPDGLRWSNMDPPLEEAQCLNLASYKGKYDRWSFRHYVESIIQADQEGSVEAVKDPQPLGKRWAIAGATMQIGYHAERALRRIVASVPAKHFQEEKDFEQARALFKQARESIANMLLEKMTPPACAKDDARNYLTCSSRHDHFVDALKRSVKEQVNDIELLPPDNLLSLGTLSAASESRINSSVISASLPMLYLAKSNPEAFSFVIAHEFGHKVEALFYSYGRPKQALADCLRSSKSVKAGTGNHDQLSEAFADWFGVEYMTRSLKKPSAYSFRRAGLVLCKGGHAENDPARAEDPHPVGPDRLNRIFAAHPKIRAAFGAKALQPNDALNYCAPPESYGQ